jgi:DNA-binding response OmpR family regulator
MPADTPHHDVPRPDPTEPVISAGPSSEWFFDHPKVLVIDDDADTRDLIAVILERDGLTVLQAADAASAVETILDNDVAAVILDVVMPGIDGHSLCRQLRDSILPRDIPVIMLTGLSGLTDEIESVLSGASAHLTKPVRPVELVARLRDLL